PQELKFHRTKITNCIKEFGPMFKAVKVCLDPIFERLNQEDKNDRLELPTTVAEPVCNKMWN
ncbi:hypothetical protein AX16_000699, partial [Volvariella volvacea WC 439]